MNDPVPSVATNSRKKRRPYRVGEILAAATKVFYERGYHAAGMDEIGAQAGLTGPAIYRHFKSKQDVLEHLLLDRAQEVLDDAREHVEKGDPPLETLEGLVSRYVEVVVDNPSLSGLVLLERRSLSADTQTKLSRAERLHFEEWVHALMSVRPELSDTHARVLVQGAGGLVVRAALYRSGLPRDRLVTLITEVVYDVLLGDAEVP